MVQLRSEQKGLELDIQVDSTLPDKLYGDSLRIGQIIVNILNNAVKYTEKGKVTFLYQAGIFQIKIWFLK